jgi:hypothetical protein
MRLASVDHAGPRPRRRLSRRTGLGLLAATVVVAGAGGAVGMYDGLGAAFEYGFEMQISRSVEVGASDVVDGFRVTIDRGYLDAERLMLAVEVTDELERPEVHQLQVFGAIVSDESGVWRGIGGATGSSDGRWTARAVTWRRAPLTAAPTGSRRIHVAFPHIEWYDRTLPPPGDEDTWNPWRRHLGPWTFDIELPIDGAVAATIATPDVTVDIDGVPVTLRRVVLGPTAIRVEITFDDERSMAFIGRVRRGDTVVPFAVASFGEGEFEIQTDGGVDDPSGEWVVEITEAVRGEPDGAEVRVQGPWRFPFSVP